MTYYEVGPCSERRSVDHAIKGRKTGVICDFSGFRFMIPWNSSGMRIADAELGFVERCLRDRDVSALRVIKSIQVGALPWGITISPK
jgi:hypothetical protein